MIAAHIDTTRARLGELATMSHQTQEAERKILANAQEQLAQVEQDLPGARRAAMTGGGDKYMELVKERGRLHQIITAAKRALA